MRLLPDKVALVTGAGRGIGRAIAQAFAEHGARVAVTDISMADAEAVAATIIQEQGPVASAFQLDVTDAEQVRQVMDELLSHFGRIDILVNNAGIYRGHDAVDFPLADWDAVFAVNVRGAFLCSQIAARQMIAQGDGGCIINMSSASGKKPDSQGSAYCASKSAIIGLTRVLALELGPHGIRVNAVLPGATDTAMLRKVEETHPGVMDILVHRSCLGHIATPRDQANGFVFLASDLARHITGEQLVISGGEFMET